MKLAKSEIIRNLSRKFSEPLKHKPLSYVIKLVSDFCENDYSKYQKLNEMYPHFQFSFESKNLDKEVSKKALEDYFLGLCYLFGLGGVDRSIDKAVQLVKSSAEKGFDIAQNNLGCFLAWGLGVEQSPDLAFFYFSKAAEKKLTSAERNLALCYKLGFGTIKSLEKYEDYLCQFLTLKFSSMAIIKESSTKLVSKTKEPKPTKQISKSNSIEELIQQLNENFFEYYFLLQKSDDINALLEVAKALLHGKGTTKMPEKAVSLLNEICERQFPYSSQQVSAAELLAQCYLKGEGTAFSIPKAIHLCRQAAHSGFPDPLYRLGLALENQSENFEQAISCFKEAAELGQIDAQYKLGKYYLEHSEELAYKYFKLAADKEHIYALNMLGICYKKGIGVPQSFEEAVKYFQLSANKGSVAAFYNLGVHYENGWGVEQSFMEAFKWFKRAADCEDSDAQYKVAKFFDEGKGTIQSDEQAFKYYKLAGDQGHSLAQNSTGACYDEGKGVPQSKENAFKYISLASNQNNSAALFNVGLYYEHGWVVEQSFSEAFKYFKKAADLGEMTSQHRVGKYLIEGKVKSNSDDLALEYFKKAADQGHAKSAYQIGLILEVENSPFSLNEAYKYYSKAAEKNHAQAHYRLGILDLEQNNPLSWQRGWDHLKVAAEKNDENAQNVLAFALLLKEELPEDLKQKCRNILSVQNREALKKLIALDSRALYLSSLCYRHGWGIPQSLSKAHVYSKAAADLGHKQAQWDYGKELRHESPERAFSYIQLAADQGNPIAQYWIGLQYFLGKIIAKDRLKALEYIKLAADNGIYLAQQAYGRILIGIASEMRKKLINAPISENKLSQDLSKKEAEGIAYLQKSAESGAEFAQRILGSCLWLGKGNEMSYEKAIQWWKKAAQKKEKLSCAFVGYLILTGRIPSCTPIKDAYPYLLIAHQEKNVWNEYFFHRLKQKGFKLEKDFSGEIVWNEEEKAEMESYFESCLEQIEKFQSPFEEENEHAKKMRAG